MIADVKKCPSCGSLNSEYEHWMERDDYKNATGTTKLAMSWGFQSLSSTRKCRDCGANWSCD